MQKLQFRKQLFWDTDMSQLDFEKHTNAIIVRVPERGSEIYPASGLDY